MADVPIHLLSLTLGGAQIEAIGADLRSTE